METLSILQWEEQREILQQDLDKASLLLTNSSSEEYGFHARIYIRAFAAWVEGIMWLNKQLIIRAEYEWYKNLPIDSQAYLYGFYWTKEDGREKKHKCKNISTKDNIKTYFKVMNELFPLFEADYSNKGWQSLLAMYKKRNSIMHPNKPDALEITSQEIHAFEEGKFWFNDTNLNLLHIIRDKVIEALK